MTAVSSEQYDVFRLDGTLWNVSSHARALLFDRSGFRFSQWLDNGAARLIKSGSGRSIYRVELPGLDVYIKHFCVPPGPLAWHRAIRRGRAEREYRVANLLWQIGIPTIRPLALGERRRHGLLEESFLLTETIPGNVTLFDLIEEHFVDNRLCVAAADRRRITLELARLAARLHQAGLEHRDLHERNIVLQSERPGLAQLYLLDLHELREHRRLTWNQTLGELARLGRYFSIRTERTDRLRFFREYAACRGISRQVAERLARDVEHEMIESRADFWRRRDVKAIDRRSNTQKFQAKGVRAWARRSVPTELLSQFALKPDIYIAHHVQRWWKWGKGTQVAEITLPEVDPHRTFIVKRYIHSHRRELIASLARDNAAVRAWKNGESLRLRELRTPEPLMVLHHKRGILPRSSYLVTECVPHALTIAQYLEKYAPQESKQEQRRIVRGCIEQAARLLRRMHDRRVTHHDLKATNILASKGEDPARPLLWLIDLDGVQTWQRIPERKWIQNLARFSVSFKDSPFVTNSDRLWFLRRYLGGWDRDQKHWKRLWAEITRWTARKVERNRRRGRSLI